MKLIYCLLLNLFLVFKTYSQHSLPPENIYLHVNQSVCFPGDTVFFKTYVLADETLSGISTTLYLDLFDSAGQQITKQLFPLYQGIGIGQLIIPYTLSAGMYYLRAYTKYQCNFTDKDFFQIPITVFNSASDGMQQVSVLHNRRTNVPIDLTFVTDSLNQKSKGLNVWQINVSDTNVASLSITITDSYIPSSPILINNRISEVGTALIREGELLADSSYLSITGYARTIAKSKPIRNKSLSVMMQTADSAKSFEQLSIDSAGRFMFDKLFIFDSATIAYQLNDKPHRAKDVQLHLDEFKPPAFCFDSSLRPNTIVSALRNSEMLKVTERKESLFDYNKIGMMQAVVVTAKQKTVKEKLDEQYTSGGYSAAGDMRAISFDVLHDVFAPIYSDVLDYLQNKVFPRHMENTLYYLNQLEVEKETLKLISMSDVAYIVIHPAPFVMGKFMQGGVCVYTKNGNAIEREMNMGPGLNKLVIKGYDRMYLPTPMDYSDSSNLNYADNRLNLYWYPLIEQGQHTIRFYNNDFTKRFRIVIEGVGKHGELMRWEKVIE